MPDGSLSFAPEVPQTTPYSAPPAIEPRARAAGITPDMVRAGVAAVHARWGGLYLKGNPAARLGESATELAVAAAFMAMDPISETGLRDTLQNPGQLAGSDPRAWAAMSPRHRADHVFSECPAQILGAANVLIGDCNQLVQFGLGNAAHVAKVSFVANSLIGLARLLERASAVHRRSLEEARALLQAEREARQEVERRLRQRAERKAAKDRKKPKARSRSRASVPAPAEAVAS